MCDIKRDSYYAFAGILIFFFVDSYVHKSHPLVEEAEVTRSWWELYDDGPRFPRSLSASLKSSILRNFFFNFFLML